jgi:hypothetical protein
MKTTFALSTLTLIAFITGCSSNNSSSNEDLLDINTSKHVQLWNNLTGTQIIEVKNKGYSSSTSNKTCIELGYSISIGDKVYYEESNITSKYYYNETTNKLCEETIYKNSSASSNNNTILYKYADNSSLSTKGITVLDDSQQLITNDSINIEYSKNIVFSNNANIYSPLLNIGYLATSENCVDLGYPSGVVTIGSGGDLGNRIHYYYGSITDECSEYTWYGDKNTSKYKADLKTFIWTN